MKMTKKTFYELTFNLDNIQILYNRSLCKYHHKQYSSIKTKGKKLIIIIGAYEAIHHK